MKQPSAVMVSLSDSASLLKSAFKDYIQYLQCTFQSHRLPELKHPFDYDCIEYLDQLITEIFADVGQPEMVGGISHSTQILINDGMDHRYASEVTLNVFRSVVDTISAVIPEMRFGNRDGYHFDLCGEGCAIDLCITLPRQSEIE